MHLALVGAAAAAAAQGGSPALQAALLGLMAPGAGFLLWTGGDAGSAALHLLLALASLGVVAAGFAAWFATGPSRRPSRSGGSRREAPRSWRPRTPTTPSGPRCCG
jgi:hypothetical protein